MNLVPSNECLGYWEGEAKVALVLKCFEMCGKERMLEEVKRVCARSILENNH